MRTSMDIRQDKVALAKQRIASGFYANNLHVEEPVVDLLHEDLIRRGSGATGDQSPAATDASVVSPPSGDGVQVAQHPARLAVGEPMQPVDLPPVVRGPEGLYRESADVAEAWERFEQDAKALPWILAAVVFAALCIGCAWYLA